MIEQQHGQKQLFCDRCRERFEAPGRGFTAAELRKLAKEAHWRISSSLRVDHCPRCSQGIRP